LSAADRGLICRDCWAIYQYFISPILWLLNIVIIIYVVLSWLIVLGVVQQYNPTSRGIMRFCQSIIDPLVRPIRKVVPRLGMLDLSLFILILIIGFVNGYLLPTLISMVPF
jgi:YggT family protein